MPRQKEIPGTERPKIPELDAAIEAYEKAKRKRMKATEVEVGLKQALIEQMEKHKVESYTNHTHAPPLHCTLSEDTVTKIKVDQMDPEPEDEPDDEEEKK